LISKLMIIFSQRAMKSTLHLRKNLISNSRTTKLVINRWWSSILTKEMKTTIILSSTFHHHENPKRSGIGGN
jgi:hypothetical protein